MSPSNTVVHQVRIYLLVASSRPAGKSAGLRFLLVYYGAHTAEQADQEDEGQQEGDDEADHEAAGQLLFS